MTRDASETEQSDDIVGIVIPWLEPAPAPDQARVEETRGLVQALGCRAAFASVERVRAPSPSHLFTQGLLERLKARLEEESCTLCVVDATVSPVQQRNLERALGLKVIDRTGLILEIFGLRARTREGVIQVELARLLYERSRLVRTWTHLERQRGGRGFLAGPGESQLEADRRMLDRSLKRLRQELEDVRRTRGVQRAGRRRGGAPVVALVGYTNAGKSTLFNRLTGAAVFAEDMPFATLDPTVRRLDLPTLGKAVLVDTVGFISELPTHLIESFQATLEEAMEADLLVHVRDRSSQKDADQNSDVLDVLQRLERQSGAAAPAMIEAWNKADKLDPGQRALLETSAAGPTDHPAVVVSAATGEGLEQLLELIERELTGGAKTIAAHVPASDGRARAWLYEHGDVLEDEPQGDGSSALIVRLQPRTLSDLLRDFPDVETSGLERA